MQQPANPTRRVVHSWDKVSSSGKRAAPQGHALRFREAVPDYVTLLTERTRLPLEPFENACFARWGDHWANRLVPSITADELQAYFAELAQKGHASREIEREKSLLRWFYRWAMRCGWTNVDPTADLERTRTLPNHPAVTWTSAEQRRLLEACRGVFPCAPTIPAKGQEAENRDPVWPLRKPPVPPAYLNPIVLIGLRSGLRLGHLLNLEWRHVDLKSGRITIPASEVKNGCAIDVAIDGDMRVVLTDMLRLAHKAPALPKRVFEAAGLPLWRDRPDEHAVLHVFRRVRKHAGVPEGDFNSLRLTFARNCACAGVPIAHPLRVSDWDDAKLVQEVYDEVQERTTNTLLANSVPAPAPAALVVPASPAAETGSKTEIIPVGN